MLDRFYQLVIFIFFISGQVVSIVSSNSELYLKPSSICVKIAKLPWYVLNAAACYCERWCRYFNTRHPALVNDVFVYLCPLPDFTMTNEEPLPKKVRLLCSFKSGYLFLFRYSCSTPCLFSSSNPSSGFLSSRSALVNLTWRPWPERSSVQGKIQLHDYTLNILCEKFI